MPRAALVAVLLAAGCQKPTGDAATPAPEAVDAGGVVEAVIAPTGAPPVPADELPALGKAVPRAALTARITLPADDGPWPWTLAAAPPKVEGKGATIGVGGGLSFLVVSPESGRFLYAQLGDNYTTRFVLGNVVAGRVLAEWEVKDQMEPLDISPDGSRVVAKNRMGDGKLVVFEATPEFHLVRRAVIAHDKVVAPGAVANSLDAKLHVAWAGFLGDDRVASAAAGGQVRVFDAASLVTVGTLDGPAELRPTVTPDRKTLLAHAGGNVVLIDPAGCRVLGSKAFPLPAGEKEFAVSPDGATLACARHGRVRFLSLTTGDVWDQVMPDLPSPTNAGGIAWAGPKILAGGDHLFAPEVSFPVWSVGRAAERAYTSRQVWAAAHAGRGRNGERATALVRTFDYAPPDLAAVVAAGKGRPGIYTLAPWSPVKVDVSKLPAAQQAAVRADLEARLTEVGYVPAAGGEAVLAASLDPSVEKRTNYTVGTNVPYTETPLRLQLRHGGRVAWQDARAVQPPYFITIPYGQSVASLAASQGFGEPHYAWAREAPVPPDVRGPAYPTHGFGTTHLDPAGARFQPAR